jgi:hypothetical protein
MPMKIVSASNVFEVDPAFALDVTIDLHTGQTRLAGHADWIADVMVLDMHADVAPAVRKAFDAVRGSLCYAYWYAPLLSSVASDVLRIADLALVEACRSVGRRSHTMSARIATLRSLGAIARTDEAAWAAVRRARGALGYPFAGEPYGFASTLRLVTTVRDLVDRIALSAPGPPE